MKRSKEERKKEEAGIEEEGEEMWKKRTYRTINLVGSVERGSE